MMNSIRDTSAQDTVLSAQPWWQQKRMWLAATVLIAALAGGGFVVQKWSARTIAVSRDSLGIATVTRGTLVRDIVVNGKLVAANSPALYSTTSATVRFKVKAGDAVRAGDVVAELDSPDLMSELRREEASLQQLEADIEKQKILARKQKLLAQRDADTAEIERLTAERAYQRIEQAGVAGVVQKNEFQRARDALDSAIIRARHARQATELENEEVVQTLRSKQAQLQQQQLVRDNLQRRVDALRLRAPVSGVVGTLAVADRTVVAANTALMTLVDLSELETELEIPESYVSELSVGMPVELTVNGSKVSASLSALSPEVVRNQVVARARFSGSMPAGLRQSQRISARLLLESRPNVLMLSRGSFLELDGGQTAWVLQDGQAVRKPVRTGATSLSAVEIVSGLREGEQVVISGAERFADYTRVQVNQH